MTKINASPFPFLRKMKIRIVILLLVMSLTPVCHAFSDNWEAEEVCSYIALLPTKGFLLNQSLIYVGQIDMNHDGVLEEVSRGFGGTSGREMTLIENQKGLYVTGHFDNNLWPDWSAVLPFKDSYFIIYYSRGHLQALHSVPLYATYINQNDEEKLICKFEYKKEITHHDEIVGYSELCGKWRLQEEINYIEFVIPGKVADGFGRPETSSHQIAHFDFNNDGEKDYLQEFYYDSGRGAGCSRRYYELLSKDMMKLSNESIRAILPKLFGVSYNDQNGYYSSMQCKPYQFIDNWFEYRGGVYLEINNRFKKQVILIEAEIVKKICEDEYHPKILVKESISRTKLTQ